MFLKKKILVVVPARGGSKGIKLKNLYPVGGRPLIEWTADFIHQLGWVDSAVVSTDHVDIAKTAKQLKLECPFYRPPELSGDCVSDMEVLNHALIQSERYYESQFEVILMLQPTSPLRNRGDVENAATKLITGGHDSVVSVSKTNLKYHPLKQLQLEGERLSFFAQQAEHIVARQQLSPCYHRNGVVYAFTRECILHHKKLITNNSSAVIIDTPCVNIDSLSDIEMADKLLNSEPDHKDELTNEVFLV